MSESLWNVDVTVMPKEGVNDPEGEAILGGLRSLGYPATKAVRAGRLIRLTVRAASDSDAAAMASEMADRLLANPVIEVYSVAVTPATAVEVNA